MDKDQAQLGNARPRPHALPGRAGGGHRAGRSPPASVAVSQYEGAAKIDPGADRRGEAPARVLPHHGADHGTDRATARGRGQHGPLRRRGRPRRDRADPADRRPVQPRPGQPAAGARQAGRRPRPRRRRVSTATMRGARIATGTMLTIDNQIDATTGTFPREGRLPERGRAALSEPVRETRGSSWTSSADVVIVPAARRAAEPAVALRLRRQGRTRPSRCATHRPRPDRGRRRGRSRAGSRPGEAVVVDGVDKLQQGTKVTMRHAGRARARPRPRAARRAGKRGEEGARRATRARGAAAERRASAGARAEKAEGNKSEGRQGREERAHREEAAGAERGRAPTRRATHGTTDGEKGGGDAGPEKSADGGPSAREGQGREARKSPSHEPLPAVHPAARGDLAPHGRGSSLVGVVAYRQLPVSALPQVDYPTIQVLTF